MKAITWILLFICLAVLAAYPFVFHCSYGWDVEQMRIACKGEGKPKAVGTVSPTPRPRWEVRDAPLDWEYLPPKEELATIEAEGE